MRRIILGCVLLAAGMNAAMGAEADDAAALLRGTVGQWSGTLTYSDYQSGKRTELPVVRTASLLLDGKTLQVISAYDDGPSKLVYINALALLNKKSGRWESASFRDGDAMETSTAALTLPHPAADPTHWTVVTLEKGTDGDSPATIRQTITRDGGRLTTLTEYDRLGDADETFAFRNEETVTLATR